MSDPIKLQKQMLLDQVLPLTDKLEGALKRLNDPEKFGISAAHLESKQFSSDIETTLRALQDGSCILFLGPEIALDQLNPSQTLHERQYIKLSQNNKIASYDRENGFFSPPETGLLKIHLHKYYDKIFSKENALGTTALYYLAQLPFKLIISFSPDDTMHRLFTQYDRDHHFLYYSKKSRLEDKRPKIEKPVLINAVGSLSSGTDQYIYTHKNFYDYLIDAKFPTQVKNEIKHADHLLFFGIDFTKWQGRLLLFMLGLGDQNAENWLRNEMTQNGVEELLAAQFKLSHVNNNYIEFAKELAYQACLKHDSMDLEQFFMKKQLLKARKITDNILEASNQEDLTEIGRQIEKLEKRLKTHGV